MNKTNLVAGVVRRITLFKHQQIRSLPRWTYRRPVRVIPAEEYDKSQDIQIKNDIQKETKELPFVPQIATNIKGVQAKDNSLKVGKFLDYRLKTQNIPKPLTISKTKISSKKSVDMLETIIDKDGNFIYSKMKNTDSRISSILVQVKSKKEKETKDLILLEGKRLIKDALNSGCKLEYILFSRMNEVEYLRPFLPKLGAKLYKMPYREMQIWSDLTTNPGIMGIFKVPDTESFKPCDGGLPLMIVCDNVREPTNLGAILRTCSGVGCGRVILTKGCVNVWDTKVLRSAMGAHFTLQIKKKLTWDDVRENISSDSSVYIADNSTVSADSIRNKFDNDSLAELIQAVPVLPYYGVNFSTDRHIVLIIGGETEGISEESYKLASDFKGVRLNVPLSNNIDSLNAGTALGVIAFEVKRQLLRRQEETKK